MALGTAISVPTQLTGNMIACEVTTSALLLIMTLSMYSGLALNLLIGFAEGSSPHNVALTVPVAT